MTIYLKQRLIYIYKIRFLIIINGAPHPFEGQDSSCSGADPEISKWERGRGATRFLFNCRDEFRKWMTIFRFLLSPYSRKSPAESARYPTAHHLQRLVSSRYRRLYDRHVGQTIVPDSARKKKYTESCFQVKSVEHW